MVPTALIVALFLFASVLAIMLYLRVSREKRDRNTLELVTPARLSVLIDNALKNGGTAEVIAGIFRVLTDTLGCRRLIYIRRSGVSFEYEFSLDNCSHRLSQHRQPQSIGTRHEAHAAHLISPEYREAEIDAVIPQ